MRVVTLNLWGRQGAWAERRPVLQEGLRALHPDVVAFQEAIETDAYDQVTDLLGDGFHLVRQRRGLTGDGSGATIASRWPPGTVREADLHVTPQTSGYPCTSVVAEILAPPPFGPLVFVNHKPSWQTGMELERELQAVAAARCVAAVDGGRGLPVVVAGDFDAPPDAPSVRYWANAYIDAWEHIRPGEAGHTFSPRNPLVPRGEPGRRIDYVLVRRGRDGQPVPGVARCALAFDEPADGGVWASDHFGVVADLLPVSE